jgi:hypothetical protein
MGTVESIEFCCVPKCSVMLYQYPRIAAEKNKKLRAMCCIFQRGYNGAASYSISNSTARVRQRFAELIHVAATFRWAS